MKYLKTYENWFSKLTSNLLSSPLDDEWEELMDDRLRAMYGYNKLMSAAVKGDFKKFKELFPKFINRLDETSDEKKTVLFYVIEGEGDLDDMQNMIKMLIENGADPYHEFKNKTFYEKIKNRDNFKILKKWVEDTYPEIVEKIELIRNTEKYNL